MDFSERFYTGEGIKEKASELLAAIKNGKPEDLEKWKKEYILILALNPVNLLELIPVKELGLQYYREQSITVVGLAANKGEAVALTKTIVEDMLRETEKMDIKHFFS